MSHTQEQDAGARAAQTRRVLVTGAAGFVGRRQTETLVARGHSVVAFIHSTQAPEVAGVTIARGDIRDQDSIAAALDGVSAVIHLAAAKNDEKFSREVNVGGTANLIAACRLKGVRRLIYVSTQADARGAYGRTKYEAERLVTASGLDWTVLKPNLIYGADKSGAFAKVAAAVMKLPVVPITGPAHAKLYPIHVDDNCLAIAVCLENDKTIGKVYVLAGPGGASLTELVEMIGEHLGKRPRMFHLPLWFSLLAARACCLLSPNHPPISVSNVLGCNQEDVDHDITPMRKELGVEPRLLEEGLRSVLRECKM